jgi:alcohol dehydrogenase class IV
VERALLLTGHTLSAGRLITHVRDEGGSRIVGEFSNIPAHTPTSAVQAAAAAYNGADAEGIIAFGGGSVVDCAKAVAYMLDIRPPLIDLATTLSGAEFACSFGQTDDDTKVKLGGRDPALTAKAIFLDPELTGETPSWLWAATGMRAVDHAVESVLAPNAHPYVTTLALQALRTLRVSLPRSLRGGDDERMACFFAAWMAHSGSYFIEWGLSHQMGRQLGPRFGIPHGYTSAILLPAVVELEVSSKQRAEGQVAAALGVPAGEAAGALRGLVQELSLPGTLQEAGIDDRATVERLFGGNEAAQRVIDRCW